MNTQKLQVSCGSIVFTNAMIHTHKLIAMSKEQFDEKLKIRIFFDTPDDASKNIYMVLFIDLDSDTIHYWIANITFKYHNINEILTNDAKIETFDKWQSFERPSPPKGSGSHRYILYLFEQRSKLENPHFFNRKIKMLDLNDFILKNGLKLIDKKGVVINS
jgi:hypothetical protein